MLRDTMWNKYVPAEDQNWLEQQEEKRAQQLGLPSEQPVHHSENQG